MSKKHARKARNRRFKQQRRLSRMSRQVKLGFEQLEPRHLLTTLTVNSLDDLAVDRTDSVVTLRDAIDAANNDVAVSFGGPVGSGADTITFAPSLSGGTINLSQGLGELDITSDLTIIGLGAAQLTIDANNDTDVDGTDLGFWEAQFGGPAPLRG